ncbi:hypothetical protein BDZ90DRAFT_230745 [Jaminaea rosea]|uniref:Pre-mRNA-splicing factor CEF1 n=1 Tax=Jaminaea rosea TaxID=1569628 RepID=A0A316UZX0_9BASI|nr:hypothetical protein BDZ90DRAFT_230745 [Jaminaea rosea]PWN28725.1 hypothetical protein BDZ90DRAFT_230745 [Jaminaea rosea]
MVRVQIKGGVWKNTEDEILKAAISKYGMNQWARISSLLVRKTPKQCKARWYEWLDPAIKKTEWSKEEDEKLLHLAKLMPTQWRTIAPIVGRTATQCLERYQRLLDEAEEAEGGAEAGPYKLGLTGVSGPEAGPSAEDVRRLRPGEIDPDPESKPARPDPIDMDEDEKEMLSEARARLANTQGKKAKRKDRERALEEARRLAILQKRRELKAAGIVTRGPKVNKKGTVDYNADIPFEKQPVKGFYDTSEEASKSYQAPVGKTLGSMERKRPTPDDAEAERRKKQSQQSKEEAGKRKDDPFGERAEQIRKMKEAEQISKRRKLTLPAAQVGEKELEEIVKLGQSGERARDLVAGEEQDGEATEGLLSSFDALEKAKTARTPRTAPEDDAVMREARNLRNMTAAQTPLLGDANADMEDGLAQGATGATPRSSVVQTPNPLLTPRTQAGPSDDRVDPRGRSVSQTPMRTPFRDGLGLNDSMSVAGTPFDERRAQKAAKQDLLSALRNLPRPKNDFELVLDDEDEEDDDEEDDDDQLISISEDAADRDARMRQEKEEERLKALARRSLVVQRDLPRPANVDAQQLLATLNKGKQTAAQRLVLREMVALIKHDTLAHPIAGSSTTAGTKSDLPVLSDSALAAAREEVRAEMAKTIGFPGANETLLKRLIAQRLDTAEDEDESREEREERLSEVAAFDEQLKKRNDSSAWSASSHSWVPRSSLSMQQWRQGQAELLNLAREQMTELASKAAKEERKLGKVLGGYQARSRTLGDELKGHAHRLAEGEVEHAAFERLALGEGVAVGERVGKLEKEVQALERREAVGQGRYKELDDERRALRERVEELRAERDMREAERLNEAALAAED